MADAETARKGEQQQPETGEQHQPETGEQQESIDDIRSDRDKWKHFARNHEALWKKSGYKPDDLKELVAASKRLKDIDDADKTEMQKLAEKLAAADAAAAESKREHLRLAVAYEKGLPMELAERLRGDSEEALFQDAEKLLALLDQKTADDSGKQTRPKEALRPGAGSRTQDADDPLLRDLKGKLGIS